MEEGEIMKGFMYFMWIVQGLILIVPVTLMAIIMGMGGAGVVHFAAVMGMVYMTLEIGNSFFL